MHFGSIELNIAWDGYFRLDGGAMFGVVPKPLWSKIEPADERNRILLSLNPLVIRSKAGIFLVDAGIGSGWDEKRRDIFGIEQPQTLHSSLEALGISKNDVTGVICTHLHFDHIGGAVEKAEDGAIRPAFPNAKYYIQRGEWECAVKPNERTRASYISEHFISLKKAAVIHFLDGSGEIAPGIAVEVTGGHTLHHQIIFVRSDGRTACYFGDLIPTSSHLHLPYIMGYDTHPVDTLAAKKRLIEQAITEHWLVIFSHSPIIKAGYLIQKEKSTEIKQILID